MTTARLHQLELIQQTAAEAADLHTRLQTAIRQARQQGLSLRAIAEAAGVSYETVRRICAK